MTDCLAEVTMNDNSSSDYHCYSKRKPNQPVPEDERCEEQAEKSRRERGMDLGTLWNTSFFLLRLVSPPPPTVHQQQITIKRTFQFVFLVTDGFSGTASVWRNPIAL